MTQFKTGQSGNPKGRPIGSVGPLARAKQIILEIFQENEDLFAQQLRDRCSVDPVGFYGAYVVPFMPKEIALSGDLGITNNTTTRSNVLERIDALGKQLRPKTSPKSRAKRAG